MLKYGVFSGPYFPAFGLNTERYEVSLRIQSECGKIRSRKNSIFGHFSGSANSEIYLVAAALLFFVAALLICRCFKFFCRHFMFFFTVLLLSRCFIFLSPLYSVVATLFFLALKRQKKYKAEKIKIGAHVYSGDIEIIKR